MALKKSLGVVFIGLWCISLSAQTERTISLEFKSVFGDKLLVLDSLYSLKENQTIQFENLKFYISNIQLLNHNKVVWQEKQSFHLYDESNTVSHLIKFEIPKKINYDKLRFDIGIDSVINVSGALGGDLDPTKGMYWTWQSGYINFKLEGSSSLSTHSKKEFQLHLGGYQKPFNTLQTVYLNRDNEAKTTIEFDIESFIEKTDLQKQHHIMSPNNDAVKLSSLIVECFKIK